MRKCRDDWRCDHLVRILSETMEGIDNVKWGCEVGVWKGNFSRRLLTALPNLSLVLVDPYLIYEDLTIGTDRDRIEEAKMMAYEAVKQFTGQYFFEETDSITASQRVKDNFFDFIFIDANHTYDHVKADIRAWWPKVKPGGILSGHDYDGQGDKRGRFGVKKAVVEWAIENNQAVGVLPQLVWYVIKEN